MQAHNYVCEHEVCVCKGKGRCEHERLIVCARVNTGV